MDVDRKEFLTQASLGVLAFTIAGHTVLLTARQARAQGIPLHILSAHEARTLEAMGETLLPGARQAGIANFVDQQLGVAPEDGLVVLRYLDFPPPYTPFYQASLATLDHASQASHHENFADLSEAQRRSMVESMGTGNPPGWQGPPAPLVYFALRSDAVDVVYGTVEGFAKLQVPYMPHILPPRRW